MLVHEFDALVPPALAIGEVVTTHYAADPAEQNLAALMD
jgi:hypothetical protein